MSQQFQKHDSTKEQAKAARYFRCAYADSYFRAVGEVITYFAPHCPDGGPAISTLADCERCANRRPLTDCEVSHAKMLKIRSRLLLAVEEHEKRVARQAAIDASNFRDLKAEGSVQQ
jgi:hypothetical protein